MSLGEGRQWELCYNNPYWHCSSYILIDPVIILCPLWENATKLCKNVTSQNIGDLCLHCIRHKDRFVCILDFWKLKNWFAFSLNILYCYFEKKIWIEVTETRITAINSLSRSDARGKKALRLFLDKWLVASAVEFRLTVLSWGTTLGSKKIAPSELLCTSTAFAFIGSFTQMDLRTEKSCKQTASWM